MKIGVVFAESGNLRADRVGRRAFNVSGQGERCADLVDGIGGHIVGALFGIEIDAVSFGVAAEDA